MDANKHGKSECRMTNDEGNPKSECRRPQAGWFRFSSFGIRASSFVITESSHFSTRRRSRIFTAL